MKKMNKRSQGHIEMMLSFALFLGAVLFIFIYINPFAKTAEHSDELNSVQNIIINQITANVGRLSVIGEGGCYYFNPTYYTNSNPYIKYVAVEESSLEGKKQYTVYFGGSDVFLNDVNLPGYHSGCANYRLGVFSNQTIISSKKLAKLILDAKGLSMDSDYEKVKKDLGIKADFSINTINFNTGEVIEDLSFSKSIPGTVEVNSREFPIVAINETGQANQLILNIKVWQG